MLLINVTETDKKAEDGRVMKIIKKPVLRGLGRDTPVSQVE